MPGIIRTRFGAAFDPSLRDRTRFARSVRFAVLTSAILAAVLAVAVAGLLWWVFMVVYVIEPGISSPTSPVPGPAADSLWRALTAVVESNNSAAVGLVTGAVIAASLAVLALLAARGLYTLLAPAILSLLARLFGWRHVAMYHRPYSDGDLAVARDMIERGESAYSVTYTLSVRARNSVSS